MNYQFHYNKLIEKAKNRIIGGYTEEHHIIPRSIGGSDDKNNLVCLSLREHFIAHLLLAKIYGGKMWHAAWMMANKKGIKIKINSKIYEELKIKQSQLISLIWSGKKRKPFTEEHLNNMSLARKNKPKSNEWKRKLSLANKGIPNLSLKDKPKSKEAIEKRTETRKKNRFNKEMYIYMSAF